MIIDGRDKDDSESAEDNNAVERGALNIGVTPDFGVTSSASAIDTRLYGNLEIIGSEYNPGEGIDPGPGRVVIKRTGTPTSTAWIQIADT